MRLYGFWRSSATWRVRIALNLKGIGYEYVPIHLSRSGGEQHNAAFRNLNPMKHVPVLTLDRDGKTHQIAESLAIIELLEELWPEPALLPKEPFTRARARQIAQLVSAGIQPLLNTKVQSYLRDPMQADADAWTRHWLASGLNALEELTRETAGKFAVGDELSIADLCIVPQLYAARRFHVSLDAMPTLLAIEQRCAALEAFQRAEPHAQPDAD
jgi:maleylpyruvate isomerase